MAATTPGSRCIECEEIELARVRDARPSQMLPLPRAALAGFPQGRSNAHLTRRRLLQMGVAGFASVYGSRLLGLQEVFEAAVAEASPMPTNCLVVLYIAGGNDGLNTVLPGSGLPADYASYVAARSALHRGQGPTPAGGRVGSQDIPATGAQLAWANVGVSSAGAGDNGGAYGFDTLYGAGNGAAGSDLAVMTAVDYLPYSLSHFDSSDYWFAGALSSLTTGWLGRWIDANGSATNPLQAVSLDTALSKDVRTQSNPVCAIAPGSTPGFSMNANDGTQLPPGTHPPADVNGQMQALRAIPAAAGNTYLSRSRQTYGRAVDVFNDAASLAGVGAANAAVKYPAGSQLATKLKFAAQLLQAGLGTRIITIHWGAFDTHGGQLASQDPQLAELSQALGAFKHDLQTRSVAGQPIEPNVATLVFSEFGRRVGENGSGGTDHGAGGLMLLSGSAVKGGWATPFPGCKSGDLDTYGNLKVPTDYRSVYQAVLEEWLGGDTAGVLPGGAFPSLQRSDGTSKLFK
jgi:uncharacterized protein (DUF1501 family)